MRSLTRWVAAACAALSAGGVVTVHAQTVAFGGKSPPAYLPAPCCPPGATPEAGMPRPADPTRPDQTPDPARPDATRPDANTQPQPDAAAAFADAGAGGLAAGGGGTQIAGRIDALGRFNLFDNMSAIPQNRVWFTYMYGANFQTGYNNVVGPGLLVPGVQPGQGTQAGAAFPNGVTAPTFVPPQNLLPNSANAGTTALARERALSVYRFGGEYAFTRNFSIAAQTVYLASAGTPNNADAWGNPQIMLKYALVNTCDSVFTGTFAVSPQVSASPFEIHESTTRLMPGFLVYQTLSDDYIFQGGAQLNFATTQAPDTFDYALSLGRWFYRDPNLDPSGRLRHGACEPAFFRGVLGQLELFGKHVIAGNTDRPNDLGGVVQNFRERSTNIDMTANTRVLLGPAALNFGVGVPLTGTQVRSVEFLTGINVNY
jgi:hypothetical protein